MRLDIPDDLPREIERPRHGDMRCAPLEPLPYEHHRERLADQASHPPSLNIPKPERPLRAAPERSDPRDHDVRDHEIPHDQRMRRNHIPQQGIGLSLRDEEIKVLADVGRFRVIATRDLAEAVYGNRPGRMERDLAFLREHGLVEIDSVQARRDGRRGHGETIEVITLTRAGRDLARQASGLPDDQKLYAGLVKPREVEHDAQIYRAYRKEAERIEKHGGRNLRVELDFELKAKVQKAIYAERKADPEREMDDIKQQVAEQFELPFVNDSIQIPDARIEYDTDLGLRTGHEDIEVLTAAYHPGHLRGKAQAGFRLYASGADRSTLTARIEDEHHLLDQILEL
jgi:hypothetical protein